MDDLFVKPLPTSLLNRYKGWKATQFEENKVWYKRLADEGQKPRAMIISCCDSRVHATSIFGADMGEFFIHRNIANLVPPFKVDMEYHGTSAAVEYAIKNLKIPHLIVLGHSNCGGIKGGYEQSQKNDKNNSPVLTFEGKKYDVNNLSNDTKEIIKGLQIAETQLKMYEDTLKLLSIGRNSLAEQLRVKLKNYE